MMVNPNQDIPISNPQVNSMEKDSILSPETIIASLPTRFIGHKVIHFPTLDSTMNAAKREALWGAQAGTVIIADEQKEGRGRLQRTWISPRGGLAFSIILRPNLAYLQDMIMLASLAVAYGIRDITGLTPQIKWPNDILINNKKVCGILIETDIRKDILRYLVIGFGINVNLHTKDYSEIASTATSLADQLGHPLSRLDLIRQILIELDKLYQALPQEGSIFEQWKKNLVTLGQLVAVNQGDTVYRGNAESVNRDGSLMLRQDDGSLIKIIAGDVVSGK
jgi:BirA family transcriptional regulator, biotin operon repressor / biotin---[acetyl-CoA-carboxylase] ligase